MSEFLGVETHFVRITKGLCPTPSSLQHHFDGCKTAPQNFNVAMIALYLLEFWDVEMHFARITRMCTHLPPNFHITLMGAKMPHKT